MGHGARPRRFAPGGVRGREVHQPRGLRRCRGRLPGHRAVDRAGKPPPQPRSERTVGGTAALRSRRTAPLGALSARPDRPRRHCLRHHLAWFSGGVARGPLAGSQPRRLPRDPRRSALSPDRRGRGVGGGRRRADDRRTLRMDLGQGSFVGAPTRRRAPDSRLADEQFDLRRPY